MSSPPDPALEAEIARLDGLGLTNLRDLWAQRLGAVPKLRSADLMRRRLAYELQARAYGDLKPQTCRRLKRYYEAFKKNPSYTPTPIYPLKPGTMLVREWRGVIHRVGVMDDGFEYNGQRYSSLSKVARCIAGTRWSGPLFFGLRDSKR